MSRGLGDVYKRQELFINDGEQTASVVIPTPLEANEIIFTSDEAATVNIEKYEITFN